MSKRTAIVVGIAVVLASCSSSDGAPSADPDPTVETETSSEPATTGPAEPSVTDDPNTTTDDSTTSTISSTTTTEPPVADEVVVPSADQITLLSPAEGQGTRPLLAWEPIDGATYYTVTVYAPDGRPYWASVLEETETFVGGPVQIDEDKPGPRVIDDMSWMVIAYGEEQLPLAVSGIRPIGP